MNEKGTLVQRAARGERFARGPRRAPSRHPFPPISHAQPYRPNGRLRRAERGAPACPRHPPVNEAEGSTRSPRTARAPYPSGGPGRLQPPPRRPNTCAPCRSPHLRLFLGLAVTALRVNGALFQWPITISEGAGSVETLVSLPGAHLTCQALGKFTPRRSLRFPPPFRQRDDGLRSAAGKRAAPLPMQIEIFGKPRGEALCGHLHTRSRLQTH